jgi:Uma2 family endonuclease
MLLDATDPRRQDRFCLGADLVVEVVSPNNPECDTVTKVTDRAEAGIPESWNRRSGRRDDHRTDAWRRRTYTAHGVFRRGGAAASRLRDGFRVSVDAVMDGQ